MLHHEIDTDFGILTVTPSEELAVTDFKQPTDVIDDYNTRHEPLQALEWLRS